MLGAQAILESDGRSGVYWRDGARALSRSVEEIEGSKTRDTFSSGAPAGNTETRRGHQ